MVPASAFVTARSSTTDLYAYGNISSRINASGIGDIDARSASGQDADGNQRRIHADTARVGDLGVTCERFDTDGEYVAAGVDTACIGDINVVATGVNANCKKRLSFDTAGLIIGDRDVPLCRRGGGAYAMCTIIAVGYDAARVFNSCVIISRGYNSEHRIKAAVFGLALALIGCHQGYNASGGAKGVGLATMRAVVISSVAILVLDFVSPTSCMTVGM